MLRFKQEVLDKMLSDATLFAMICEAKGIKPGNLGTVIRRNGNSINQYSIVKIVADYLGKEAGELVEEKHIAAA